MNKIKNIIAVIFLLILSEISIAQSSDVYNIKYAKDNGEQAGFLNIRIKALDSLTLFFDETIEGSTLFIRQTHSLPLDKINSLSYTTGMSEGTIDAIGAGIGFSIGFGLGYAAGDLGLSPEGNAANEVNTGKRIGTGFVSGVVMALPFYLATSLFSKGNEKYIVMDISKNTRKEKYKIVHKLIYD